MNPLQRKIMQARLRRRQDEIKAIDTINTISALTDSKSAQRQEQTAVLQDVLSGNTPSLQTLHGAMNKDQAQLNARNEAIKQLMETKEFPMWAKILIGIVCSIVLVLIIAIIVKG